MSCMLTASPRPLIGSPFSVKAVCLLRLLDGECSSSTFLATTTPLAFCHGPLPMRLRASTPASPPGAVVERYARQFVLLEPAVCASAAQCASAPSSPPRSAPLPLPTLVTKKVMSACCACAVVLIPALNTTAETNQPAVGLFENLIQVPPRWKGQLKNHGRRTMVSGVGRS